VLACVFGSGIGAAPARADETTGATTAPPTDRARAHYETGIGLYHLGNYRAAIREFTAGYELGHQPEFLINIGQAYRSAQRPRRAREYFARYLAEAPQSSRHRDAVQGVIDSIDAELGAKTRTEEPELLDETPSAKPLTASKAAQPASLALASSAPAPVEKRPLVRRAGFWVGLVGAAVVVGGVIALGLTLGGRHDPVPSRGTISVNN
jgi:hypothetical protein